MNDDNNGKTNGHSNGHVNGHATQAWGSGVTGEGLLQRVEQEVELAEKAVALFIAQSRAQIEGLKKLAEIMAARQRDEAQAKEALLRQKKG